MKHLLTALAVAALAGCATSNPDVVPRYGAQRMSQVYDATVLSVRPVVIDGSQSGIGAGADAALAAVDDHGTHREHRRVVDLRHALRAVAGNDVGVGGGAAGERGDGQRGQKVFHRRSPVRCTRNAVPSWQLTTSPTPLP